MGFLRSTKGSIISDYFQLQEDIAGFSKGYMYDVALYDDHLEITSMQKCKLLLNYDQITDVFYGGKTELIQKPKSVIGRVTDLIKNQYGSDVYELVQLYSKLNEAGKKKIMEELRDTAALEKYTEPVKRDAQKMA